MAETVGNGQPPLFSSKFCESLWLQAARSHLRLPHRPIFDEPRHRVPVPRFSRGGATVFRSSVVGDCGGAGQRTAPASTPPTACDPSGGLQRSLCSAQSSHVIAASYSIGCAAAL